jgi:hypothetical protein
LIRNHEGLLSRIRAIQEAIREEVVAACEHNSLERMSEVVSDGSGDTAFAIDRVSEATLLVHFEELAHEWPCVLIFEGQSVPDGVVLPCGTDRAEAELCIIVDPVDGSRGLMYQKRSAWILTGVAPNRGPDTDLTDIELAVQTEIPLIKQHLCDSLWAVAGRGAYGERTNRFSGERWPLSPRPSRAETIAHGFGGLSRFMPGARAELAAIDDLVYERVLGPVQRGKGQAFEDQYICTGGQLYELAMGHDRWIADLRPLVEPLLRRRGAELGLCCHPYDLCTELIARESGVVVTDERGRRLSAPLDLAAEVAWIGYANPAIRDQVASVLLGALNEHGMIANE